MFPFVGDDSGLSVCGKVGGRGGEGGGFRTAELTLLFIVFCGFLFPFAVGNCLFLLFQVSTLLPSSVLKLVMR